MVAAGSVFVGRPPAAGAVVEHYVGDVWVLCATFPLSGFQGLGKAWAAAASTAWS